MFCKNNLLFILITLLLSNLNTTTYNKIYPEKSLCQSKRSCQNKNNKECLCYCSGIGAPREKKSDDKPIYVENDPNEVYCYCKQWDLDKYPGPASRD